MSIALKIENLSKTIGKRKILHDISFDVHSGEVFGFLGPNGAGKTTTIKIAVGLLSLDEGNIYIDGIDIKKDFEKAVAKIGGIVENPEMYKNLTGMQNLQQYARMREGVTKERINEVVDFVGLRLRIKDKVSKYSLGMRQRLGVAQALLHNPKVLILDEPTNGLDPSGIKELRDMMKKLAHEQDIAVLVSSHLMAEMEMMCDRIGIIADGKLISTHTMEELTAAVSTDKKEFKIQVDDSSKAVEVLDIADVEVSVVDEKTIKLLVDIDIADDKVSEVTAALVTSGVKLFGVSETEHKRLEDVFIELTQTGGKQIG